jgi:hypothetical protein
MDEGKSPQGEGKSPQGEVKGEKILKWTLYIFIGFFGICLLFLALNLYYHQDSDVMKLTETSIFLIITLALITTIVTYCLKKLIYLVAPPDKGGK